MSAFRPLSILASAAAIAVAVTLVAQTRAVRPNDFSAFATITLLPDLTPEVRKPARAELVAMRLKSELTPEMLRNFDLFLYVSKADRGPLAQRMIVFQKQVSGALKPAYDWAVSTGREQDEINIRGRRVITATPKGYYQLDPRRMYRDYRSASWDQDMPNAMFFNWERAGLQTGLAIHAAAGDDIAKLGQRASAGCVHLAPENAAMLYDLIRADYRGQVPRLAYNDDTQTMSNRGAFMRNRQGKLKMTDGYRVLVMIEDYDGADVVASLF
jgi:L,D-transpeptidase catalytic domain